MSALSGEIKRLAELQHLVVTEPWIALVRDGERWRYMPEATLRKNLGGFFKMGKCRIAGTLANVDHVRYGPVTELMRDTLGRMELQLSLSDLVFVLAMAKADGHDPVRLSKRLVDTRDRDAAIADLHAEMADY